jgi:hypothetical protein
MSPSPMNTFQWLLVLGFSPADAAAAMRPEIFAPANTSLTDGTRIPYAHLARAWLNESTLPAYDVRRQAA